MFLRVLKVTYNGMHYTQGRAVCNLLVNEFIRKKEMKISFNVIFPYGLKHFAVFWFFVTFFLLLFAFLICENLHLYTVYWSDFMNNGRPMIRYEYTIQIFIW